MYHYYSISRHLDVCLNDRSSRFDRSLVGSERILGIRPLKSAPLAHLSCTTCPLTVHTLGGPLLSAGGLATGRIWIQLLLQLGILVKSWCALSNLRISYR